jgi:hypothetical protein
MSVGKIVVVNKYKHTGAFTYIGRGSVFGNPYPVTMGRDQCIEKFREHLDLCLKQAKEHPLRAAMRELARRVLAGETVYLGCFCKPKACHGDIIKQYVEGALRAKLREVECLL